MKLNPALFVLGALTCVTFAFLWSITPTHPVVKSVNPIPIHPTSPRSVSALTQVQKTRVASFAQNWAKSPSYDKGFNALDPSYKIASISDSLFDPSDEYWGLPRDEKGSFELVEAYCTACHSLSIVMQQRATPERWEELLVWMEEKQGMAKLPKEDESSVLEYISAHFSMNDQE